MTTRFGTTRRRAHTVHRFGAVQSEHSLRGRNLEDRSLDDDTRVLLTCRELRIGIVPYSPLGRGFLGGRLPDPARLQDNDYRRHDPRFQGEHHEHNRRLLVAVNAVAARHEAKPAQVALAWLLARGPDIVPIPGTKRRSYLEVNAEAVHLTLTPADLAELDALGPASGERYTERGMATIER